MKPLKTLLIAFLVALSGAAIAQIQDINVGTSANDRSGDPIRTAFQKVNSNFDYVESRMVRLVGVAVSDETTAITAGTGKITFRMPYAMTVTGVRASLNTAQSSGNPITVDINENGSSILSTKLTFDNGEKTTTTSATAAVVSDTALADDAEITIDIDQIGDGTAAGLKVWIIGY